MYNVPRASHKRSWSQIQVVQEMFMKNSMYFSLYIQNGLLVFSLVLSYFLAHSHLMGERREKNICNLLKSYHLHKGVKSKKNELIT